MKKLTMIVSLMLVCSVLAFAAIKSERQFNAEVPNSAIQLDGTDITISGNVSSAESVTFSVTTDTNTAPTSAGQIILDDQYNLYISTVSGGSWYKLNRSTVAGTLGQ